MSQSKMSTEECSALIIKAAALPKGDAERRAILASLKEALVVKVAMKPETAAFVDWVNLKMADDAWSERQLQKYLERLLKRDPSPSPYAKTVRRKPPLEVGDMLIPKPDKAPDVNGVAAEKYKYEPCTVEKVQSDSVLVKFDNGQTVEFFGTKAGAPTGLFRYTPKGTYSPGPGQRQQIEVVYFAKPGEVDQYHKDMVKQYTERGEARGEQRHSCYYSGTVGSFKYTKDGNVICTIIDQQRPYPVSISPEKGRLLYMAPLNRRRDWKADYKKDVLEIAAAS